MKLLTITEILRLAYIQNLNTITLSFPYNIVIHKSQVIFKYEWTFFKKGNDTLNAKMLNLKTMFDPELITLPSIPTQNENCSKTSMDSPEKQYNQRI